MLKILTWNLNAYGTKVGPWEARLPMLRDAIEQNQPDILVFQAVRQEAGVENGLDQAGQISRLLPDYRYMCFQPAWTYEDGSADGLALLSRIAYTGVDFRRLTFLEGTDDPNHRIVLHAQFDFDSKPFHLFNGYFSWVGEQAEQNLKETLDYLNEFEGRRILMGDFNQSPDSQVIQRLQQSGWVDAWARLNPADEGYTFDSRNPSLRIDYVWADAQLQQNLRSIRVIAGAQAANGIYPSDHAGLLVAMEGLQGDSSPS